jgi:glycosyltransferase involved in cell wall biosynthesis
MGLAQAEAHAGASVEFVAAHDIGAVATVSRGGVKLSGGRQFLAPFEIPGIGLAATLWKSIGRADIVHLHSVWNGVISLSEIFCRIRHVPYVLSPRGMLDAHNMERRRSLKKAAYRVLEHGNIAGVAGWHFLDLSEREGCSWLPAAANARNVLIAPNGLDVAAIRGSAERPRASFLSDQTGEINLVFLGRIHPIKGLDLALEAVRTLADSGVRCVLHLIGPDDGCLTNLLDRARTLQIADRVRHLGAIYGEERFSILRNADAVILTSHYECNSVTAAETLAAGGLLIATDTCHMEVARSAGAAVVVPRDRFKVADAVREWVNDSARSGNVRERARGFAQDHLAWPPLAERMIEFYHRVLGHPQCAG